ncbi:hypothetical protein AGLY_003233 [Aphis glycines]|uniref:Uncharacterized protein n=1 Tax=Aphis glycines TaxID=307491 RepID=A0A6G0U4W3_APHGL|nr:hypothetical protein AGLY_003233 [Aphis glycines]
MCLIYDHAHQNVKAGNCVIISTNYIEHIDSCTEKELGKKESTDKSYNILHSLNKHTKKITKICKYINNVVVYVIVTRNSHSYIDDTHFTECEDVNCKKNVKLVEVEFECKRASMELMELLKWIETVLVMTPGFWIKRINTTIKLFSQNFFGRGYFNELFLCILFGFTLEIIWMPLLCSFSENWQFFLHLIFYNNLFFLLVFVSFSLFSILHLLVYAPDRYEQYIPLLSNSKDLVFDLFLVHRYNTSVTMIVHLYIDNCGKVFPRLKTLCVQCLFLKIQILLLYCNKFSIICNDLAVRKSIIACCTFPELKYNCDRCSRNEGAQGQCSIRRSNELIPLS